MDPKPVNSHRSVGTRPLAGLAVVLAFGAWACSDSGTDASVDGGSVSGATDGSTSSVSGTTTSSVDGTSVGGMTATSGAMAVTTTSPELTTTTGTTTGVGGATSGTAATSMGGSGGTVSVDSGMGGATSGMGGASTSMGGASTTDGTTTGGGVVDDVCPYEGGAEASGSDWVNGDMLEFNDNGGWCWYQDERVLVDEDTGELIISSVASGGNRNAQVEITHWNIASGQGTRHQLRTMAYTDDHDAAALVKRPDGGYAAMWAGHNDDCNSYYSVYNGSSWSNAQSFAWPSSGCPTSTGKSITYANTWYLGDMLVSYVRSLDTSPHYLYSNDDGSSWQLGGRLTATPQVGYVAGYYKYWGNNTDRIDFFGTEAHPRDNDNSLYHGYIQGGQIYNSNGQVVDSDFSDMSANDVPEYTRVFQTGTSINGVSLEHMWNADLVRYDDGTVAAIGTGRVSGTGSDDPDKRLLYFRFDGSQWTTTYLAKAGTKLYSSEQDYTGLGALDPDNPHIIYISTPYDPRTDEGDFSGYKEIWKGVTCDDGATFDWEPVTANSTTHNVRPVVPKWDANNTALLWLRGTYTSAQSYNQRVVGLIEQN